MSYDKSTSLDRYTEVNNYPFPKNSIKYSHEYIDVDNIAFVSKMEFKENVEVEKDGRTQLRFHGSNEHKNINVFISKEVLSGDVLIWDEPTKTYLLNGEPETGIAGKIMLDSKSTEYEKQFGATSADVELTVAYDPCYRYEEELSGKVIQEDKKEIEKIEVLDIEGEGKINLLDLPREVAYELSPYYHRIADRASFQNGVQIEHSIANLPLSITSIENSRNLIKDGVLEFDTYGKNLYVNNNKQEINLTGTSSKVFLNKFFSINQTAAVNHDLIIKTDGTMVLEKMSMSQSMNYDFNAYNLVPGLKYRLYANIDIETTDSNGFIGTVWGNSINMEKTENRYTGFEFTANANGEYSSRILSITEKLIDLKVIIRDIYFVESDIYLYEDYTKGSYQRTHFPVSSEFGLIDGKGDHMFWDEQYGQYHIENQNSRIIGLTGSNQDFVEPQKPLLEDFSLSLCNEIFNFSVEKFSWEKTLRISYSGDGLNVRLVTIPEEQLNETLNSIVFTYLDEDVSIYVNGQLFRESLCKYSNQLTIHGIRGVESVVRNCEKNLLVSEPKIILKTENQWTRLVPTNEATVFEVLSYSNELAIPNLLPNSSYSFNWKVKENSANNAMITFGTGGNYSTTQIERGVLSIITPEVIYDNFKFKIGGEFGAKIDNMMILKGNNVKATEFFEDSFNLMGEPEGDGYSIDLLDSSNLQTQIIEPDDFSDYSIGKSLSMNVSQIEIKNAINYIMPKYADEFITEDWASIPYVGGYSFNPDGFKDILCYNSGKAEANASVDARTFVQTSERYISEEVKISKDSPLLINCKRLMDIHDGGTLIAKVKSDSIDFDGYSSLVLEVRPVNEPLRVFGKITIDSSYNSGEKLVKLRYIPNHSSGVYVSHKDYYLQIEDGTVNNPSICLYGINSFEGSLASWSDYIFPDWECGDRLFYTTNGDTPRKIITNAIGEDGGIASQHIMSFPKSLTNKNHFLRLPNGSNDYVHDGVFSAYSKEYTIDEKHNWVIRNSLSADGYITFRMEDYKLGSMMLAYYGEILPENGDFIGIRSSSWVNRIEGIYMQDSERYGFSVTILAERLSTPDVAGFKEWIAKNPLKVHYQLGKIENYVLETESYFNFTKNQRVPKIRVDGMIDAATYIRSMGKRISVTMPNYQNMVLYWDYEEKDKDEILAINLGREGVIDSVRVGAGKLIISSHHCPYGSLSIAGKPGVRLTNLMLLNSEEFKTKPAFFKGIVPLGMDSLKIKDKNNKLDLKLNEEMIKFPSGSSDYFADNKINKISRKIVLDGTQNYTGTYNSHNNIGIYFRENDYSDLIATGSALSICSDDCVPTGEYDGTSIDNMEEPKVRLHRDGRLLLIIPKHFLDLAGKVYNDAVVTLNWLKENPVTVYIETLLPENIEILSKTQCTFSNSVTVESNEIVALKNVSFQTYESGKLLQKVILPAPLEKGSRLSWSNYDNMYRIEDDNGISYLTELSETITIPKELIDGGISTYKFSNLRVRNLIREKDVYESGRHKLSNREDNKIVNVDTEKGADVLLIKPKKRVIGEKTIYPNGQPLTDLEGNELYSFTLKNQIDIPVKDGLVSWLDMSKGSVKDAQLFDPCSGKFLNLIGFTFDESNGWTGNSLKFAGAQNCILPDLELDLSDYTVIISRKNNVFKPYSNWLRAHHHNSSGSFTSSFFTEYFHSTANRLGGRMNYTPGNYFDYTINPEESMMTTSYSTEGQKGQVYEGKTLLTTRMNNFNTKYETIKQINLGNNGSYKISGELYFVAIYNRVLSEQEIFAIKDFEVKRNRNIAETTFYLPKQLKNGVFPVEGKEYESFLQWNEVEKNYEIVERITPYGDGSGLYPGPTDGLISYIDVAMHSPGDDFIIDFANPDRKYKIHNPKNLDLENLSSFHDLGIYLEDERLQNAYSVVVCFTLHNGYGGFVMDNRPGCEGWLYADSVGGAFDTNGAAFVINGEAKSYSQSQLPRNKNLLIYGKFDGPFNSSMFLGMRYSFENILDGEIYSLRVYDRKLTAEEYDEIFQLEAEMGRFELEKSAINRSSDVSTMENITPLTKIDKLISITQKGDGSITSLEGDSNAEVVLSVPTKYLNDVTPPENLHASINGAEQYFIEWDCIKQARRYLIYKNDEFFDEVETNKYPLSEFEGNVFVYASNEKSSAESSESYIQTSPLSPGQLTINQNSDSDSYSFDISFIDRSEIEDGFKVKYRVDDSKWNILDIPSEGGKGELVECSFSVYEISNKIEVQVVSYNESGENDIIPINTFYVAHIKEWTYVLNSSSVLIVFDDMLENETAYKIKHIKKSDSTVSKDSIVANGNVGQEYQHAFSLSPTDEAEVSICPVVDGKESLYSKPITASKNLDKTLKAPSEFRYEWIGPGLVRFFWKDIYDMEQGFEFSFFRNNGSEEVIKVPSTSVQSTGTEYYYDVQLEQTDNIIARARMYWRLNKSEYTNTIDVTFHPVTGEPVEYVRKSRNQDGILVIDWQRQSYVENYQLDYTLDGVEKSVFTKDNRAELDLDYLSNAPMEVKVKTHFSGGVISDYSDTLNWSITGQSAEQEVFTFDSAHLEAENTVMTYEKDYQISDSVNTCSTNKSQMREFVSSTHTNINRKSNDYEVTTWRKQGREKYDNSVSIVTPTSTKNGIFDEMVYIPREIKVVDEMYVRTATKNLYDNVLDISKVRIATIGDSITSGHPGYYAETGNGDVRSQYQYWLDRRLKGAYEIINKGYGSDRSWQILARFERDILPLEPAYVIIQGGTNDLYQAMGEANGNQEVLDTYLNGMKQNMASMVQIAKDNNIRPIVGTLIPRTGAAGIYQAALYDFNDWIIKTYSADPDADYIDFFNAGKDFIPPTPLEHPEIPGAMNPMYDGDTEFDEYGNVVTPGPGIHPSMEGYKVMGNSIPLSLFILNKTELGVYLDENCSIRDNFDGSNTLRPVYKWNIGTLRRKRIKTVVRYVKNNGDKEVIFSMYANSIEGVDLGFIREDNKAYNYVSGRLAPGASKQIVVNMMAHEDEYETELELYMTAREISEQYES